MCIDNGRSGGISVYVGNHIRSHSLNNYCNINDIIEINTVKITLNCNQNINIIAIYGPPVDANILYFNVHIGQLLASFHRSPVYVVGDLNIDIMREDVNCKDSFEGMRSQSYVPLITIPTRATENSAALLDHIWTNQLHDVNSGVLRINTTDHFPILTSTIYQCNFNNSTITKVFRDHSERALNNLISACTSFIRYFEQFSSLDIESRVNIFHETL